jgi:hypothetical protein
MRRRWLTLVLSQAQQTQAVIKQPLRGRLFVLAAVKATGFKWVGGCPF